MLTAIDIRRLRLADLASIERVERRAYPTPWSRTMFAGEIAKSSSLCFGGFAGDTLAGYIIVSRHVDAWHVMNVAVDEPFRHHGLAQRMLESVFEETAGDGTRGYTLEVRVSNHGAIRLYERLGFQPTGIRRGYYTDNREDALIMWRDTEGSADPGRRRLGRMILGIETSCDETCAAVVDFDGTVRANVVASQAAFHQAYGGVVPEIASRRHLELVGPVVRRALEEAGTSLREVDRIAVTAGPGLVGALLVGVSAAKAYAYAARKPLVPVDHLQGHVASLFLQPDPVQPPLLVLLASGGHTLLLRVDGHDGYEVLGRSLDDAAGEAFDKGARLLGLGYPGGVEIERLARDGDPGRIALPTPMAGRGGHDLSFSGLKTALLHRVEERRATLAADRADLAAAYQRAIVRALVERAVAAATAHGLPAVGVVGGVAANGELRASLAAAAAAAGLAVHAAPLAYCGDNAAMIASAARFAPALAYPSLLDVDAYARAPLGAAS